ncbi:hypothetical protein ACHAXN_000661 [Cyclotella atomus]
MLEDTADTPEAPTESRREIVAYQPTNKTNKTKLLAIHQSLALPSVAKSSTKQMIFDSIVQSGKVEVIYPKTFAYQVEVIPDHLQKGPKWKILTGTEVVLPEGFKPSGVEEGYFAPMNKENAAAQKKLSYLTDTPITRPSFVSKTTKHRSGTSRGHPVRQEAPNEKGGPSNYACNKINEKDFTKLRPKDFFDLIISPGFIDKNIVNTTNMRATAEGAGRSVYQDWVPFTREEVYKFTGLMFCNGISPKPQVAHWFKSTSQNRILGNDAVCNLFDVRVARGKVIAGLDRWYQYRRFMQDPAVLQKNDPLWKVASILEETRKNSQRCWTTGWYVAIDEQTIGFKGKHGLALQITYKREGVSYQCDALCEARYTYSFYFRHGDAPPAPDSMKD